MKKSLKNGGKNVIEKDIDKIIEVSKNIRIILKNELKIDNTLKNQCKRASILFDIWCKQNKIKSYIKSGFITKDGDKNDYIRGHVWNILRIDKTNYILDLTLTQFEDYINKDIPEVLFMNEKDAKINYFYIDDLYGKYKYKKEDVRQSLIEQVLKIT